MTRTRRVVASAVLTAAALTMGAGAALAAPPETEATPSEATQTEQAPQQTETTEDTEGTGAQDEATDAEDGTDETVTDVTEQKPAEEAEQKPAEDAENKPGTTQFTFSSDLTPAEFFSLLLGSGFEGTVTFDGTADTEA
jgi:hypothetical protein